MQSLPYALQLWQLATLLNAVDSYVLLAANLEDFRSLAKKFAPNKLADKLTDIVSESTIRYREDNIDKEEYAAYSDGNEKEGEHNENEEEDKVVIVKEPTEAPNSRDDIITPKNIDLMSQINIDELADKVRERLTKGFPTKDQNENVKQNDDIETVGNIYRGEQENTQSYKAQNPNNPHTEYKFNENVNKYSKHENKQRDRTVKLQKFPIDYNNNQREKTQEYINEGRQIKTDAELKSYNDEPIKTINGQLPFEKIKLKKKINDSYEDYEMPKKDYNVYASEETTDNVKQNEDLLSEVQTKRIEKINQRYPQIKNLLKVQKFAAKIKQPHEPKAMIDDSNIKDHMDNEQVEKVIKMPSDYEETNTNEPEEMKARTEKLWDDKDYPAWNKTENRFEEQKQIEKNIKKGEIDKSLKARIEEMQFQTKGRKRKIVQPIQTTRKKKIGGTGFPTREVYKMVTPNYYAKLPIIAEKYNFEEPIPEKDREPENLKSFPNFEASINGKVKLKPN